jgi:redox-sensitive bicupin YhaK (pirin superfamily)
MLVIRRAQDRGQASFGWLESRHTFSFGHYFDPDQMGFGALRVINEDRVQPGRGFDTHGHRDMEIVSYVLEGALEHEDSMGNGSIIRPGEVQRMTAGTGIRHSEYNHSDSELVHFLQIWIVPERKGLEPGYEQKIFTADDKRNRLRLVGSRDGRDGSVTIHRDVDLYATILDPDATVTHRMAAGRKAWLQIARGNVMLDGQPLAAGDGAAIDGAREVTLTGASETEVLLFDMA